MANILVVDDEHDIVAVVARIMERRGHHVSTALDGEEALERIAAEHPDLVILDVNLPKVDGFEVCRRLKTDPATADVPVVMMTAAFTEVTDANHGVEVGADEYVVKPFVREILIHNVERLIEPRGR